MPNTEVRFVGKESGPITTEGGALLLAATHTLDETPEPDLVLIPGATTTPGQMLDDEVLAWIRKVHEKSTGHFGFLTGHSLILAASGILKGLPATTHSIKMGVLKSMGSQPRPNERIVRSGKIVTAAGVSAGIDLGLWLVGEIAGRQQAEVTQLFIEYDPQPPFDSGHADGGADTVIFIGLVSALTKLIRSPRSDSNAGKAPAPNKTQLGQWTLRTAINLYTNPDREQGGDTCRSAPLLFTWQVVTAQTRQAPIVRLRP